MNHIPEPPLLEIKNLSKKFSSVTALRNVSAQFQKGEYICILGPSGCGKSTLLRLVAGFEIADGGEIFLEGQNLKGVPPEHRPVNMVFQNYALFPHLTVFENVAFGLKMKKQPAPAIRERVGEALRLVNLTGLADRYPRQLSGGEQQRVALARAVINHPAALLLDEPLAALDKNLRLVMQDELKKIQREIGITFLHVTHDQNEAMTLADRLIIMRAGEFIQAGPPQEVYNCPANRFAAEFLGSSNIFSGMMEQPRRLILDGGIKLTVANNGFLPGKEERLFIVRPEKIQLHLELPPGDKENILTGILAEIKYSGGDVWCAVKAGGHRLTVRILDRGNSGVLQPGLTVYLYVPPESIILLATDQDAAQPVEKVS
jgi:spermidine/putrescine transport system ATP-binding protein